MYRHRGLERVLTEPSPAPVTIIEGARAAGKTTLVRHLVHAGRFRSYASLADVTNRTAADSDPAGWLASLVFPAVIDEAQLVPGLPLAVKEFVDAHGRGEQVVLTGSASIGRSGLGGADPLVRRAVRHTLAPFTQRELSGLSAALPSPVDQLFDAEVVPGEWGADAGDLVRELRLGGFPSYVLGASVSTRMHEGRVRSDVESTLGDAVLPDERFDGARARGVLDALLREPGGILNTAKLGNLLGQDRRTVDRYLDVLERRFLIHHLPNLAVARRQAPRSRAKVHPTDTSLAAEALARSGVDLAQDRVALGKLLESHVVNQLVPAGQWADLPVEAFYWRYASADSPEVDLVLVDGSGRSVAIEVKASRQVGPRDLSGIRSLATRHPLHRAFVFYTGTVVVRLAADTWAVPIHAIGDPAVFTLDGPHTDGRPSTTTSPAGAPVPTPSSRAADATVFVSYARSDDEYLDGAMTAFAREVRRSYRFQFGDDVQLFLDQDDLSWGEDWAERLRVAIEGTAFLLAMVTPGYLRSEACRTEFQQFDTAARSAGDRRLVLPLMWTDPSTLTGTGTEDPVLQAVLAIQYDTSGADIRALEPGTRPFRDVAERVARRLREVILQREEAPATTGGSPSSAADPAGDDRDLTEILDEFEARTPAFQAAANDVESAFAEVGEVFAAAGHLDLAGPDRDTQLSDLELRLAGPVLRLDQATAILGAGWEGIDALLAAAVGMVGRVADEQTRQDLASSMAELSAKLTMPELDQWRQLAEMLSALSRHLRPVSRAMMAALSVIVGIRSSTDTWVGVLRS